MLYDMPNTKKELSDRLLILESESSKLKATRDKILAEIRALRALSKLLEPKQPNKQR